MELCGTFRGSLVSLAALKKHGEVEVIRESQGKGLAAQVEDRHDGSMTLLGFQTKADPVQPSCHQEAGGEDLPAGLVLLARKNDIHII